MRTARKAHRPTYPEETQERIDARLFSLKLDGSRELQHGREVSFRGERGRFLFKWAELMADGTYDVTVYGGTKRYQSYRTFKSDRIKHVHSKSKLRPTKGKES